MKLAKFKKVIVCSVCQAVLKFYHLHFSKIKCTDCDNIITVEQINKERNI
jgi:ribosomal protein S27E